MPTPSTPATPRLRRSVRVAGCGVPPKSQEALWRGKREHAYVQPTYGCAACAAIARYSRTD